MKNYVKYMKKDRNWQTLNPWTFFKKSCELNNIDKSLKETSEKTSFEKFFYIPSIENSEKLIFTNNCGKPQIYSWCNPEISLRNGEIILDEFGEIL